LQRFLGSLIGKLVILSNRKRFRFARKNIDICFPKKDQISKNKLVEKNAYFVGQSFFETAIAWFWSNERIKGQIPHSLAGLSILKESQKGGLIIFKHSLHLELDARILGMYLPLIGMGRNHNNASINNLQDSGRKKSLKGTIDRKEVRKLVKLLKHNERVLYAIDQDYGKDNADLSDFFGVECYTINTIQRLQQMTGCDVFFLDSWMEDHVLHLEITEIKENFSEKAVMKLIENSIQKHPAEYLWQHRRFKSSLGKHFYE
jgi:KDO2-lipid IV(A) lauroyltransferase